MDAVPSSLQGRVTAASTHCPDCASPLVRAHVTQLVTDECRACNLGVFPSHGRCECSSRVDTILELRCERCNACACGKQLNVQGGCDACKRTAENVAAERHAADALAAAESARREFQAAFQSASPASKLAFYRSWDKLVWLAEKKRVPNPRMLNVEELKVVLAPLVTASDFPIPDPRATRR